MKKLLVKFLTLGPPGIQMITHPQTRNFKATLTCDDLAQGLRYDPASQVTQVLHQVQATSAQVNKAEYLYNGVGNRTSLRGRRESVEGRCLSIVWAFAQCLNLD